MGRVVAVSFGDLLQLIDHQIYLGQKIENVFYYRATEALALSSLPYTELATAWSAQVLSKIRGMQSSTLSHTGMQIKNLSNGLDFLEQTYTAIGSDVGAAGTECPSYLTQGFKLIRESLATRNGYKRISGLLDTRVSGNVYTFPTGTVKSDIETALAADLLTSLVVIATPVIVKRPIAPPVGSTYVFSEIGYAQAATFVGSQNTRKPGRGD